MKIDSSSRLPRDFGPRPTTPPPSQGACHRRGAGIAAALRILRWALSRRQFCFSPSRAHASGNTLSMRNHARLACRLIGVAAGSKDILFSRPADGPRKRMRAPIWPCSTRIPPKAWLGYTGGGGTEVASWTLLEHAPPEPCGGAKEALKKLGWSPTGTRGRRTDFVSVPHAT